MEIEIDTDDLKKAYSSIETEIKNLEDSIQNIRRILFTEIPSNWAGSSHDSFDEKMKPFVSEQMEPFLESIEAYKNYLKNYMEGFTSLQSYYKEQKIPFIGG